MTDIIHSIEAINWQNVSDEMNQTGYAVLPEFLHREQCQHLINMFEHEHGYRKTVVMERYRFGLGAYKYWDYPLPDLVQELREHLYPKLAPIANLWMKLLRMDTHFPATYAQLQTQCHEAGQMKPTPLILRYGEGGYNTLHQDLYGEVYFPIQAACFLSEPEEDYAGGEFVLTEQVPRAQSKAIVLKPRRGDIIIFTTKFRPIKGTRGYYRANMRHGVSEVQSGHRHTMGIIFHDAVS
ncbi:MAG: 2OG-Fe(II) oxygenase [Rickettsiales bacterium]|nr:2OG-Fe(II) oxygenase [Rickettsiales bacterium]